jgi:hypothetical protein
MQSIVTAITTVAIAASVLILGMIVHTSRTRSVSIDSTSKVYGNLETTDLLGGLIQTDDGGRNAHGEFYKQPVMALAKTTNPSILQPQTPTQPLIRTADKRRIAWSSRQKRVPKKLSLTRWVRPRDVNFTVVWQSMKTPNRDVNGLTTLSKLPPWQRAKAEADRRIRAARSIPSDDVARTALSTVKKITDKLENLKSQRRKDGLKVSADQINAGERNLKAAQSKLRAILDAETRLQAHFDHQKIAETSELEGQAQELTSTVWGGTLPRSEEPIVTYESCVASLSQPLPKTLQDLNWIHIPKTGTSFAATLYGYLCTSEPNPKVSVKTGKNCTWCGLVGKTNHNTMQWDPKSWPLLPFDDEPYCDHSIAFDPGRIFSNHYSVPVKTEGRGSLIGLFRDPRQRLVSAWNNNKHSYGANGGNRAKIEASQTVSEFIKAPGIPGCQTKMLLGQSCSANWHAEDKDIAQAKQVVDKAFVFVGLTEAFNASVCLFHHMFGGRPRKYSFQAVGLERSTNFLFEHYHRTPKYKPLPGGGERVPVATWKTVPPTTDPADWELFRHTAKLFARRLRDYGIMPATNSGT